MADEPGRPKDSGKIQLPGLVPGMNRRGPTNRTDYDDPKRLGATDGKKKGDEELLEKLRKRFDRCVEGQAENRKRVVAAKQFKAGKQWSEADATQRNIDQRPCLTVDRLGPIIRQVTNDQRLNRPAINVSPVGDRGDPEAAKMYKGLIRSIERDSAADIAYDTAFEDAVSFGFGFFRFNTEWESEDSMDQVIVVKRVRNNLSVYSDPNSKEPDGADWEYAFVTDIIPTDEYKATWPKAQVVNFEQAGQGDKYKSWNVKEGVRICEYWCVEKDEYTLVRLSNGHEGDKADLHDDVKAAIDAGTIEILDQRKTHRRQIRWYKTNGVEILERGEWLGKWIPIVPVFGNEQDVEGKLRLSGIIEPAMDAQRMYNYWITKYAESVALAPMAPFIMAEGQDEGYEADWINANRTASPRLIYRPTTFGGQNLPPPQRLAMPGIPEGFVNGAQTAAMDIMASTGIRFDVSSDAKNVDPRSGRAIREFNRPQDLGAAHYMDNFKRSLKHAGDIYIDLIPKIYDAKRQVMILREDDSEQKIEIDPHASKPTGERVQGEKKLPTFNPTIGKYGVTVTIGPNYATKRVEAAESMMEFAKTMPNVAHFIADLIAKNMDWEGAEEMASRLAKTIPPQLMTPDRKDMPPQVQAYVQNLETQLKQVGSQLQEALKALEEKKADRQIAQDKIDKDFEAKILGIMQKAADAQAHDTMEKMRLLTETVKAQHAIENPPEVKPNGGKPPNA